MVEHLLDIEPVLVVLMVVKILLLDMKHYQTLEMMALMQIPILVIKQDTLMVMDIKT